MTLIAGTAHRRLTTAAGVGDAFGSGNSVMSVDRDRTARRGRRAGQPGVGEHHQRDPTGEGGLMVVTTQPDLQRRLSPIRVRCSGAAVAFDRTAQLSLPGFGCGGGGFVVTGWIDAELAKTYTCNEDHLGFVRGDQG